MVTSPWRTWLSTSVFSPTVDAYQALLQRGGYSASHTSGYLHAVGHFAHWFTDEHLRGRVCQVVEKFSASSSGVSDVTYAAFFTSFISW